MTKEMTSRVYVTYIRATSEKVFNAIAKPDLARQLWGHENVSDYKAGRNGSMSAPMTNGPSNSPARSSKSHRRSVSSPLGRMPLGRMIRQLTAG